LPVLSNWDILRNICNSTMIRRGIAKINKELTSKYFAYVPGEVYREWLCHFGALERDLNMVESGYIHSVMDKDPEPAMHFRQMSVQRNLLVEDERGRHFRQAGCPATQRFNPEEIASNSEEGADIVIKRAGCRYWPVPHLRYSDGTVSLAMTRLMEMFIPDKFVGPENTNSESGTVIQDQLLIRINKHTDSYEAPTPEGVHQDGTNITSVTLVGLSNVTKGGESRLWPLSTPMGSYGDEMFDTKGNSFYKSNCLFNRPLRAQWDTVIFNDRLVKHEARPFDGPRPAYRDVILNDIRKPYSDGVDKMIDENGSIVSIK